MKNIIICFDGTWNTADATNQTNVVKTAQMLLPTDAQGNAQVVFYDEGVGSLQVAYGASINNFLGGAFGVGLMENIEDAYRFLSFNYAPGDRIFIFGFSRGAFSARSFGGLLRTCGVLRKEQVGYVKKAVGIYKNRDRQAGPDAPDCVLFRNDNSIATYTGDPADPKALRIEYMGVWDTVGALGIPSGVPFARNFNKKYAFHDVSLSRMVSSARHALSIDERRRTFAPSRWDNIGTLNAEAAHRGSLVPPYQQVWFPGDHASIGGGGEVNGLWEAALLWVVEGAKLRGLAVDEGKFGDYQKKIDFKASTYCMKKYVFSASSISLRRWRRGPVEGGELVDVAHIAQERLKARPTDLAEGKQYRPRSLRKYVDKHSQQLGVTWR